MNVQLTTPQEFWRKMQNEGWDQGDSELSLNYLFSKLSEQTPLIGIEARRRESFKWGSISGYLCNTPDFLIYAEASTSLSNSHFYCWWKGERTQLVYPKEKTLHFKQSGTGSLQANWENKPVTRRREDWELHTPIMNSIPNYQEGSIRVPLKYSVMNIYGRDINGEYLSKDLVLSRENSSALNHYSWTGESPKDIKSRELKNVSKVPTL